MKTKTSKIVMTGLIASLYVAMTLISPIPVFGSLQCRLSEILNLFAFFNPIFVPGIILGCFISNIFSSINPVLDCIFGTFATVLTMICIRKFSKNLFIASLYPTAFCIIIGGLILYTSGLPLTFLNLMIPTIMVMAGEFMSCTIIGYPLVKYMMKNKYFEKLIRDL